AAAPARRNWRWGARPGRATPGAPRARSPSARRPRSDELRGAGASYLGNEPRRGVRMTKVLAVITTSVDGYVTGPDDGPGRGLGVGGEQLHYWVFGGPWTYDDG